MKEELNICLVQTHLYWEDRDKNIEHFTNLLAQLRSGTDLVILPETFTTGFSMKKEVAETGSKTLEWMQKMAVQHNVSIAGSFFVNDNGKCYNRLHFVQPDGDFVVYNKKHLFTLTGEQEVCTPGDKQVVVNFNGWKLSLVICYDLRFPVWMRRSERNDYDAIIIVANWPDRRNHAWNTLLNARAIENQSYVLAVNRVGKDGSDFLYSGDSVIIDPMGKHLVKARNFTEEMAYSTILYSQLQSVRKSLPFYGDRDDFTL